MDENSPLNAALRNFEATEANLAKLERLWREIQARIPSGIEFRSDPEYDDLCCSFSAILQEMPAIDDWRLESQLLDLNTIAQWRLDAAELGEIGSTIAVDEEIFAPEKDLREYRFRFDRKRRELIRGALLELIDCVDADLGYLERLLQGEPDITKWISDEQWDSVKNHIDQIDTLLGSSVPRPERWRDLRRHLGFGMLVDLHDVISFDWPKVKAGLSQSLYGQSEPIPVGIEDLGELVASKPKGPVGTKLK